MDLKKFAILDGHALIFRGYYAIPPLYTEKGELVNAVFGFTTILLNILQKLRPDYLVVTFDMKGPTFRHDTDKTYKATRKETPDDLIPQVEIIHQVARTFQIPIFEQQGFEADDLIASLAQQLKFHPEIEISIISGDMDLTQLINQQIKLLTPLSGFNDIKTYNTQAVIEKYGIHPEQMIDYKAISGDKSDNINGIPGIGKKTATKLLQTYHSLDGIYENLDKIKGALHLKLSLGKEAAYHCQNLVKLIKNVPLEFNLTACETKDMPKDAIQKLFTELNFKRLFMKFEELYKHKKAEEQLAMF
ncbi:MAG: polymerase I, DNA polymerase I protein [Candidatus Peregrinibacteria bacterium GW2011_GWF2_39_17]|nr:MAG: polymerase I, DNA polymerase I protein [Candidatus Peregrinibacteria bacterium GW2011_GWF2_39_17]HCW32225.1 hypothetical protein [Candidatus Peregrinibacteria bacterium]